MHSYRDFTMIPGNMGYKELVPGLRESGFDDAWVVLNIYENLATSSMSHDAIFYDEESADEYVEYLKDGCGVIDVFIQKAQVRGNELRIPKGYDLETPPVGPCRDTAIAVLGAACEALGKAPFTGGCKAFYTPDEWKARKEEYGVHSELIICHDGGDFSHLCNYDKCCYELIEKFNNELKKKGYYVEQCTCWYSAVYKSEEES